LWRCWRLRDFCAAARELTPVHHGGIALVPWPAVFGCGASGPAVATIAVRAFLSTDKEAEMRRAGRPVAPPADSRIATDAAAFERALERRRAELAERVRWSADDVRQWSAGVWFDYSFGTPDALRPQSPPSPSSATTSAATTPSTATVRARIRNLDGDGEVSRQQYPLRPQREREREAHEWLTRIDEQREYKRVVSVAAAQPRRRNRSNTEASRSADAVADTAKTTAGFAAAEEEENASHDAAARLALEREPAERLFALMSELAVELAPLLTAFRTPAPAPCLARAAARLAIWRVRHRVRLMWRLCAELRLRAFALPREAAVADGDVVGDAGNAAAGDLGAGGPLGARTPLELVRHVEAQRAWTHAALLVLAPRRTQYGTDWIPARSSVDREFAIRGSPKQAVADAVPQSATTSAIGPEPPPKQFFCVRPREFTVVGRRECAETVVGARLRRELRHEVLLDAEYAMRRRDACGQRRPDGFDDPDVADPSVGGSGDGAHHQSRIFSRVFDSPQTPPFWRASDREFGAAIAGPVRPNDRVRQLALTFQYVRDFEPRALKVFRGSAHGRDTVCGRGNTVVAARSGNARDVALAGAIAVRYDLPLELLYGVTGPSASSSSSSLSSFSVGPSSSSAGEAGDEKRGPRLSRHSSTKARAVADTPTTVRRHPPILSRRCGVRGPGFGSSGTSRFSTTTRKLLRASARGWRRRGPTASCSFHGDRLFLFFFFFREHDECT
jgi:hypothetical protein